MNKPDWLWPSQTPQPSDEAIHDLLGAYLKAHPLTDALTLLSLEHFPSRTPPETPDADPTPHGLPLNVQDHLLGVVRAYYNPHPHALFLGFMTDTYLAALVRFLHLPCAGAGHLSWLIGEKTAETAAGGG